MAHGLLWLDVLRDYHGSIRSHNFRRLHAGRLLRDEKASSGLPLQPTDQSAGPTAMLVSGGVIALVIVLAVLARYFREANRLAWTVGPLLAVASIAVVDLLTDDSSVSAQIFLVFPALYGASQLRVAGSGDSPRRR